MPYDRDRLHTILHSHPRIEVETWVGLPTHELARIGYGGEEWILEADIFFLVVIAGMLVFLFKK